MGGKAGSRYGAFKIPDPWRLIGAHVFALQTKLGRALLPGMEACHTCDFKLCVNEDHLFEGTRKDNLQDMTRKGRRHIHGSNGSLNGSAKLDEVKVVEIRKLYLAGGITQQQLAGFFGVDQTSISRITRGELW